VPPEFSRAGPAKALPLHSKRKFVVAKIAGQSSLAVARTCASNEVEGPLAETAGATKYSPFRIVRVGQLGGRMPICPDL
jgi:hypothetical protein